MGSNLFKSRILILDSTLSILNDTLLNPLDSTGSRVTHLQAIDSGIYFIRSIGNFISGKSVQELSFINYQGQVSRKFEESLIKLYYSFEFIKNRNQFLLNVEQYRDTAAGIYNRPRAVLTDSTFNPISVFNIETSNKDTSDFVTTTSHWINFSNSFPTVYHINEDTIGVVSGYVKEWATLKKPLEISRHPYLRYAVITPDTVLKEVQFYRDSSWILSSFENSTRTHDGNLLILGIDNSSQSYAPLIPVRSSYLLAKVSMMGDVIWEKRFSNKNYYYYACDVESGPNGEIAIFGSGYDYANTGINYSNVLILDSSGVVLSETEHEIPSQSLSVFPNPTTGKLNFDLPKSHKNVSVILFSTKGQVVKQFDLVETSEIDITDLETGIYFYHTNIEGAIYSGKIVKE